MRAIFKSLTSISFCQAPMFLAAKLMVALCSIILVSELQATGGGTPSEGAVSLHNSKAPVPVFPGAQGFGTETPAGRGGQIIKVTSLKDSGSGSLRAALSATGPRIIVFEVGGTITLASDLRITSPYVTLAGQTAPSPGISLRGASITVKTHDVLIQHLRVRVGDEKNGPSPHNRDAIRVTGASAYNVVLDHLSVSWAIDENIATWHAPHDVTISNSIISEGLHHSLHPEGPHSKGILIGDNSKNIALVGNLLAHNVARNPQIKGGASTVIVNNLMYNGGNFRWMSTVDDYGAGPCLVSAIGNVFIDGPDTPPTAKPVAVMSSTKAGTRIYLSDNMASKATIFYDEAGINLLVSAPPLWHPSLAPLDHSKVKPQVLVHAGARPNERDEVDQRIVREVMTGRGRIIDSQRQVGGWPELPETYRPFIVPSHPNDDPDGNGYTNIEELLHRMARDLERGS